MLLWCSGTTAATRYYYYYQDYYYFLQHVLIAAGAAAGAAAAVAAEYSPTVSCQSRQRCRCGSFTVLSLLFYTVTTLLRTLEAM